MNEHVGGRESICPEELCICLFAWKNNDPEDYFIETRTIEATDIKDVIGNFEYICIFISSDMNLVR